MNEIAPLIGVVVLCMVISTVWIVGFFSWFGTPKKYMVLALLSLFIFIISILYFGE